MSEKIHINGKITKNKQAALVKKLYESFGVDCVKDLNTAKEFGHSQTKYFGDGWQTEVNTVHACKQISFLTRRSFHTQLQEAATRAVSLFRMSVRKARPADPGMGRLRMDEKTSRRPETVA